MNIDTLSTFFNPKSVAIVGASNTKGKVGFDIVNNLKKFNYQGNIYPINPKENMIQEIKSYKSLEECPSLIELVFIAIPAKHVINIIDQMGKLQIRFVVIISAGFKEVGHEGILLENQLLISLRSNNVRAIGPNCLGLLDTHTPLNGSFASRMPLKGNLGFISQSGALITGILDWSLNEGLGFSKFISVGNKVDIDEVDLISALAKDDQTKAILAYLESIERGRKFIEFASSITRKKPIIVIKSGISKAGARAASSHTGSMSGTNTAYEIAFKKSGVIQAKNVQELFDMAVAISSQPLPQSSKICIITNAGGPGIIATDAAEFAGLELSNLDHDTIRALQQKLPMAASTLNPIDVLGTGSADDYFTSLDLVLNDSNVSMVLIIVTPQGMTQPLKTAEAIVSSKLKYPDKPIVSVFMGGVDLRDATQFLKSHKLPCFTFPERGINALSGLWRYSLIKNRPVLTDYMQFDDIRKDLVSGLFKSLYQKNRMTLLGSEAIFVAQAYNIPCPSTRTAFTVNEAIKIAIEIGYPVAMKVSSPEIIHKTDFGGIFLNVQTEEDLSLKFKTLIEDARGYFPNIGLLGVDIQQMSPKGREIIIGISEDPQFGHLIMVGTGGIYANYHKDVQFGLIPLNQSEAKDMLLQTRIYQIMKGVRGEEADDIEKTIEILLRISNLVTDFPEILELDINPLFVFKKDVSALDVKITLSREKLSERYSNEI